MKYYFRWLLPVLTVFAIVMAAVLPQQLSRFQDRTLFYTIHTEELKIETTPPQEPDWNLIQKMRLLTALLGTGGEAIPLFGIERTPGESTPEERKEMKELLLFELNNLKELEILSQQEFVELTPLDDMSADDQDSISKSNDVMIVSDTIGVRINGKWIYLQDKREDMGNWFLSIYGNEFWIFVDKESGILLLLSMQVSIWNETKTAEQMGRILLDQIGLGYELMDQGKKENEEKGNDNYKEKAIFSLTGTDLRYVVVKNTDAFEFYPEVLISEDTKTNSASSGSEK